MYVDGFVKSVEIDLEDLGRRLVIGRKRDGRCVYDPVAKRELIELCLRPGISVTKMARDCGVNANQLSTWIRVHQRSGGTAASAPMGEVVETTSPSAFVPVRMEVPPTIEHRAATLSVQARLPNGVVVDLGECELDRTAELLQLLGRLKCSASTKD